MARLPQSHASLDIRPIQHGEEDAVMALWQDCGLTRPWNDPRRDLDFARGKPGSAVLIGRHEGRLVASIMAGHDGHRGAVYYLSVEPLHRRRGFGRAMLRSAEAWLLGKGIWKINLAVRTGNAEAQAFYERLGYGRAETVMLERWIDPSKKGGG